MPPLLKNIDYPVTFAQKHNNLLQLKAQELFRNLQNFNEFYETSVLMFAVALDLARVLGTDIEEISEC